MSSEIGIGAVFFGNFGGGTAQVIGEGFAEEEQNGNTTDFAAAVETASGASASCSMAVDGGMAMGEFTMLTPAGQDMGTAAGMLAQMSNGALFGFGFGEDSSGSFATASYDPGAAGDSADTSGSGTNGTADNAAPQDLSHLLASLNALLQQIEAQEGAGASGGQVNTQA